MSGPTDTLENVRNARHQLFAICRQANCRYRQEIDVERLIQHVGSRQVLVPSRGELHFSDRMRCPACKRRGMNLWMVPAARPVAAPPKKTSMLKEPNFRIIDHGPAPFDRNEQIATADNLMVARGAYTVAALFYPDRKISLKQGIFVVEDSKEKPVIAPMTKAQFDEMREAEASMGRPLNTKAS